MFRSLHMKLVLIMVLLIISLMTVVGAFLMNAVVRYYLDDFNTRMSSMFSAQDLYEDLTSPYEGEENGVEGLQDVLRANMGELGVDGRTRYYFILDGTTGAYLAGSDDQLGQSLDKSPNVLRALATGEPATGSDITADFMDVAIPITRGEVPYIIQIYDNRQTVTELNSSIFMLIIQALIFGLICSVLLSFLLAKTMITPIERLTAGAKRVASGDFSRKLEVASKDEIGVLTATFNSMARQLQATIREAENERNKLDTLFLHMTDGVVAFSREGGVIQKNPAAEDMLGRRILPEDTYESLFGDLAPLDQILSLEQPSYQEAERTAGNRSLELLLAPFDQESGQGGVMVVIHDVTTQRRNEEMRREFVANVSHELRTPLTNIRSYAETLVDSAGDIPPAMEKNFLGVILNESDRMTHIVQDLLTLSRFDSGRSELKLERFSFSAAVRDIYNAVLMDAQRHGHTLTLEIAADVPDIVGDRDRVLQVMMNVVSNAIKYTPDDGQIAISAGRNPLRVWMEVSDNGIGIPETDRPRIFERFYRVDKARSRESGGTGLGLSIAKEIVDRHEGIIALVDRPGPGTTIRIELPIEGPAHGK
ncbi:ATP-binding protein [uncultured Intestinimonas sp.]|uniref:ATP-binding protein n=1 Tax=uncultured Intestinimonas sp. TaxID=1689265 RepID=UPI0025D7009C|nr:ATP-binding protein [uncultured Intestinimonas sp.]